MDISLTSAIAAVAVVLLTVIYCWVRNRDVLPGPRGVPYLGLFPYLTDQNAHLILEEYKKKYGDMFSFTYTGRLYINLGSVKAMRELQVNKSDCFGDRVRDSNILVEMLRNGLAFVNGEPWRVLRKFFVQRFRDYGLNTVRDNVAGPVYDSLNATIEDLKASAGKPVNIVELLGKRCSITIRKTIFGEKGATDEELQQMLAAYGSSLEGNVGVIMLLVGPLARLLFKLNPSLRKSLAQNKSMARVILNCVKRIEGAMNEEHCTCIVEDFYKERNERRRNNDPSWEIFTDEALVDTLLQFVGDGIVAVAGLIAGTLNFLQEHPEEQDKIHAEITEVIGPNREPAAEDRINMPYTNAFLNEFLRLASFINFFPSQECIKETYVRGYRIPVGSITFLNFYSAQHDPETFEDPDTFDPNRYISAPGKPKAESPVVFGMGKRSCSGEPFAMLQTFLFLTTIMKNFKIVSSNAPDNKSADFLVAGRLELTFAPRTESSSGMMTSST